MLPWHLSDLRKGIKSDSLCSNEMPCKSWRPLHFTLFHLLRSKVSSGQLNGMEAHYTSNRLIKEQFFNNADNMTLCIVVVTILLLMES